MNQHYDRYLSAALRHYQASDQLHSVTLENCSAHVEGDAPAWVVSKHQLALVAVGERDGFAVRTICPSIGAGPCAICLRMKLTPLTRERHPAQRVAVRRRDIYGSAIAQAIGTDMTVLLYVGSCENRKRQQKPEKCEGGGYFHARGFSGGPNDAATTAR